MIGQTATYIYTPLCYITRPECGFIDFRYSVTKDDVQVYSSIDEVSTTVEHAIAIPYDQFIIQTEILNEADIGVWKLSVAYSLNTYPFVE